jgi:hypothetical protein
MVLAVLAYIAWNAARKISKLRHRVRFLQRALATIYIAEDVPPHIETYARLILEESGVDFTKGGQP